MSKNILFHIYLILILFQSVIQVASFDPLKRGTHTATLIDDKLYVLGGYSVGHLNDEAVGQNFFYLDVSKPFSIKEIEWVDLTTINLIPPHKRAAAAVGGENNNTLFLYGGDPMNREMALIYTFDTQELTWSTPKIKSDFRPLNKSSLFPVVSNKKMYLFGGFLYDVLNHNNYVSDMAIIDTVTLTYEQGSSINAPTPRGHYGAVLLPNQKIIYMGKKTYIMYTCNVIILLNDLF
jgi:N-acetylneuraminic acid mutarotase